MKRKGNVISKALVHLLSKWICMVAFAALSLLVGSTDAADGSAPIVAFGIGLDFTGSSYLLDSGFIPPDTMGAVGEAHIVELINGRYSVYRKSDGARIQTSSLDDFWHDAGVTVRGFSFDPRILWDASARRWFAAAVDGNEDEANDFLVAVSKSADPTAGWTGFAINSDPAQLRWADFPTFGINADGVFISANMFSISNDLETTTTLMVLPKADLLSATPTVTNRTVFEQNDTGSSAQPIVDLDNSGLPFPLLSAGPDGGSLKRSTITGTITSPTLDTAGPTITVKSLGLPPPAAQPIIPFGGTAKADLSTGDDQRLSTSVVLKNGIIWGIQGVGQDGRAALRWFKIDAESNTLIEEGLISDPHLAFYYGSIAVDNRGDVVVGFSGSSATQPVSVYVVAGVTTSGKTVMGEPSLLVSGSDDYEVLDDLGRNRWGDYSATVADPVDPNTFWVFQEFVSADNIWSTRISQISLGTQVAILAAETDLNNADVKAKLAGSGLLGSGQVHILSVTGVLPVPTLEQLRRYNSVLVYSNYRFSDPTAMGDVLARYMESGGGVVMATHDFSSDGVSGIDGRILDYSTFSQGAPRFTPHLTLVKDAPTHEIVTNISNFNGGSQSTRDAVSVANGAILIAHWSDGTPMIATREAGGGRIVGLNFWPPSNDSALYGWDSSSDGGLLMANALLWAARKTGVNGPYPTVLQQPQDQSVDIGSNATFTVTAAGDQPLTYFWFRDGAVVSQSSYPILTFGPVQLSDSGSRFSCLVSNALGTAGSAIATLTVTSPCGAISLIDFDNISAPSNFQQTTHLTNVSGVTFAGPGGLDGGAVLNDASNFRVTGYSGHNFLAFTVDGSLSDGGVARGPETISFANPMALVRVRAGTGVNPGQTVTLTAYDQTNAVLATASITLSRVMTPLQVVTNGIRRVVISTPSPTLVLDDLAFVPSCASTNGAPQILASTLRLSAAHEFRFALAGTLGANYEIQFSDDLTNWQTMSITLMTNSLIWCSDVATNVPSRFYRAKLAK